MIIEFTQIYEYKSEDNIMFALRRLLYLQTPMMKYHLKENFCQNSEVTILILRKKLSIREIDTIQIKGTY